jgi:hypothetical protein
MAAFGNPYIGCLLSDSQAVFAVSDEKLAQQKVDSTFLVRWKAGEFSPPLSLGWVVCALVRPDWPGVSCVAVGTRGEAAILYADGTHRIEPHAFGAVRGQSAILRGAGVYQNAIWAVGTNYTCIELEANLHATDRSPPRPVGSTPSLGFEALCSFGSTVYCAGWDGQIWTWTAGHWIQESTPTNTILSALCVSNDGLVHAVGQAGTLIIGRAGQWRAVPQAIDENLWSCVWFEDTVFAASSQQLFTLDNEEFCTVELPDSPPSYFHLSARDASLLSTGPNDLLLLLPDRMLKLD